MKKFILKFILFSVPILLIVLLALCIPPNQKLLKSLIYAQIDKDQLLIKTPSPRIIFIGGSNLSFGLNSKEILDSTGLNPINTSIHISLGLKYMLSNSEKYIQKNDIVVISPEYEQFFGEFANGKIELLATVTDVSPSSISLMDFRQFISITPYVPKYIQSKLGGYLFNTTPDTAIGIYDRKAFNSHGDAVAHWKLPKEKVWPIKKIDGKLNMDVISKLKEFENIITQRKAKLYITFPCIQEQTFNNCKQQIKEVESTLRESGYHLISSPETYIFPDSLMYNSPYHLTRNGVEKRTNLLIKDLKKVL